jgi:dihydrofolate reductase
MGRKTFDSIGRKPLPGRMNIVITSNVPDGGWPEGIIFLNMSQAVDVVATALRDVSIIGGKNIWSAFAGLADEMLLTRVHKHVDEGQHDNVVKFPLNEMVEAGFKLVTATERRQLVGDSDAYSIMQFTKE